MISPILGPLEVAILVRVEQEMLLSHDNSLYIRSLESSLFE